MIYALHIKLLGSVIGGIIGAKLLCKVTGKFLDFGIIMMIHIYKDGVLMINYIIGFFAGIIGGMGGGTILIPSLILFTNIDPKIAQSVNLLSSIPMTIFALIIHIKNKKVEFNVIGQ